MRRREFLKFAGATILVPEMNKLNEIFGKNPYKGKVWSQLNDPWGEMELPGVKPSWLKLENKGRVAGCSAAAVAYAINQMVEPNKIYELTGNIGVTPEDVIFKIFPVLPNAPLVMSAMGGNGYTVVDSLRYFGLKVDTPMLSKYSMNQIYHDELAIIGIELKDERGYRRTHYTVYSRTDETGATFALDSYFGGGGKEVRLDSYLPVWDIISVIRISNDQNDRTKNN